MATLIVDIIALLNTLKRYQLEVLAKECGYSPEIEDTDADLRSVILANKNAIKTP